MELWRRVLLLCGLFGAVLLALFVDLSPLLFVRPVDFAKEQREEGRYMGMRIPTEGTERLIRLPLAAYIEEKTRGHLVSVEGRTWEEIFTAATAIEREQPVADPWRRRLPGGSYPSRVLFFRPSEAPFDRLAGQFQQGGRDLYLALRSGDEVRYLLADYRTYSDDDFHFGTGFSGSPRPPTRFLYPLRVWSPWLALAGLALYVLLPWPRRPAGAMSYPRWRIVLTDVLVLLITVPFFSFPFLIIGGAVQAVTVGWPLLLFFWPILLLGLPVVYLARWCAAFALLLSKDRMRVWTDGAARDFLFADMTSFQRVVLRPPRWLIVASWLAVLMGRGSARVGATGRAMLLSSAAWGSLAIRMRDGGELLLGITDQLGTDILGARSIVRALTQAGVKEIAEVREIRSLGLEMVRLPESG